VDGSHQVVAFRDIGFEMITAGGPGNVGVDKVSLIATSTATPEPTLMVFPLAFLAGILIYRTRHEYRTRHKASARR
jgi:hypothetical protein